MKRTPLYDEHVKSGGRMVEFAGYELPVQYRGVIEEHNFVRKDAGMFDVSHMGQIKVEGESAFDSVQWLTPNDISLLSPGKAQYSMMLYENGTVVDDIIVYMRSKKSFLIVVNASNREKDFEWIRKNLKAGTTATDVSDNYAMIAVQGPNAAGKLQGVLKQKLADVPSFNFVELSTKEFGDFVCARTGYTGEDGFEVLISPDLSPRLWQNLLNSGVHPAGLGARDTLRLEARLSLYGHEIDETTNPLEAGLSWVIKMDKGDFMGRKTLLDVKEKGLKRKIVGFQMAEPGIARAGYAICDEGNEIGKVTSGVMSPTLGVAIGLGYVPVAKSQIGAEFWIDIRGKRRLARVVKTPFYKRPITVK